MKQWVLGYKGTASAMGPFIATLSKNGNITLAQIAEIQRRVK